MSYRNQQQIWELLWRVTYGGFLQKSVSVYFDCYLIVGNIFLELQQQSHNIIKDLFFLLKV